ncbi:MAG TPA: hypothetical protein PK225_02390 [Azonexus sp.]|nr:hypothetical protein [Azonexus sp.]
MSDKNAEVKVIVSADITGVKPGIDAVNAQLRSMSEKAKVTSNETFALFDKIDTGAKRASQQTQQAARSFTALQSEVNKTTGFFDKHTYALQNASYQLTDFAVQVQNGTRVSVALGQQLPQLLAGFGALGAVVGLAASLLPTLVTMMANTDSGAKSLKDALGDLNDTIGDVGKTAREFNMDKLYAEYNKANEATRLAMIEQVKFQQTLIETQRLISSQSLSKSLEGVGDYSFVEKMKGAYGNGPAASLAKEYGISLEAAKDMLPAIKGLRSGTEDASNFMARFGTELARSSKGPAQKLVSDVKSLADAGRDAAAAQSRLSEASGKMIKAGKTGKIEIDEKGGRGGGVAKASDFEQTMQSLQEKVAATNLEMESTEKLTAAEKEHAKWLAEIDSGRKKLTPAERQAAEAKWQEWLALDKLNAERQKYLAGVERQTEANIKQRQSLVEQIEATKREADLYGLTADQIATVTAARLEEAIAMARAGGAYEEQIAYMEEELRLQKELADAKEQVQLKSLTAGTEEVKRKQTEAKQALLDRALASGEIDEKTHKQASDKLKSASDDIDEFGKKAAQSMQQAFADFFFDPWAKGTKNMAQQFGEAVRRMIADAASAQLLKLLMGNYGKDGKVGGVIGDLFSSAMSSFGGGGGGGIDWGSYSVPTWHEGGMVEPGGQTAMRQVPAALFSRARRYHGGGLVGDEVPAILKRGEQVLTKEQQRAARGGQNMNLVQNFYGQTEPAQVKRAAASAMRQVAGTVGSSRRYA